VADGVLAPSSRTVEFLLGIGISRPRVHLVPYVVDNKLFERLSAESDPAMVREGWSLPADSFVAIFVGKQVPWKRPQDLLDAVARVPEAFAVFAGDGPLREGLTLRAKRMGLADRVRFIGFVNQSALPAVYRASDVLVLPSEFEPFGLVINEAFASGTPAIASSACGAVGDLIRDNETGFVYPCRDVAALSERIRRLVQSPALRSHLGDGARARIRKWGVEENALAFRRAIHAMVGASR
jgi:glycosyltransferase involved in cell wall biosynthesis